MARPGIRLGVAVSGGADSVCLLDVLRRLGYLAEIFHLNHGLRGAASDGDEQFVRELGARWNLAVHAERWNRPESPGNLEQAMRGARYEFFIRMMRVHGIERTATGHTLSDQAETVLLRMARGTGLQGLRGIHSSTSEGVIRPLIEVRREEAREYLRGQGLDWREDASNGELRWRRNLVRRDLLPRMAAALNPAIEEALARMAALAWDDELYWDEAVERLFVELGPAAAPFAVRAAAIGELPPALARRLVRRLLRHAAGDTRRLTREHVEEAWRLACGADGAGRVCLPGIEVWRSLGWLRFSCAASAVPAAPAGRILHEPGEVVLGNCRILVGSGGASAPEDGQPSFLDGRATGFPLVVRGWHPGDSIQPAGASSELKIKKLFPDLDVPSWDRPQWPIIECKGKIAWCRGVGAAAWAQASATESRRIRIQALPGA